MKKLMTALILGSAIAFSGVTGVQAGSYPEKPITIIFPNKAGSGYHKVSLALVQLLKETVSQPIRVQAMPGAGTALGTRFAADQPSDGYTLLLIHEAIFQTSTFGMLGFKVLDKFEALARVNENAPVLMAGKHAPFKTLVEMVKYGKANPGKIRAAINTGALAHTAMVAIGAELGIDLRLVHVSGGGAGFRQAVLAGDVDIIEASTAPNKGLIKDGKLIPLVNFSANGKDQNMDTIPGMVEAGYNRPETVGSHGYVWIAKDTPDEAKDYWRKQLKALLGNPEGIKKLNNIFNFGFGYMGGQELKEYVLAADKERAALIKKHNITLKKKKN